MFQECTQKGNMHRFLFALFVLGGSALFADESRLGIVLNYGYQNLMEMTQTMDSAIYFKGNDASQKHMTALSLHYHHQWNLSNRILFRAGPYLTVGVNFLTDPKISHFSRKGDISWGFGIDMKLILKTPSYWWPYIKFSTGYDAWNIKWETEIDSVYGGGSNFVILESFSGFIFHAAFGVEYQRRNKTEYLLEIAYSPGFVTSALSGENSDFFPSGNPYYFHSVKLFFGIQFNVRELNEKE